MMSLKSLFDKLKKLYNIVYSKDKTMQLKKFDILVQGAGQKQPHEVLAFKLSMNNNFVSFMP